MSLPRHLLVGLVGATLVLGMGESPSILVCRLLCLLDACPMEAPETDAPAEDCCAGEEATPGQDEPSGGTTCTCALAHEGIPNPPQTSVDAEASNRLLLSTWAVEPASLALFPAGGSPHRAWKHGPTLAVDTGGCLGAIGHVAFGGSWSASVLGCARI